MRLHCRSSKPPLFPIVRAALVWFAAFFFPLFAPTLAHASFADADAYCQQAPSNARGGANLSSVTAQIEAQLRAPNQDVALGELVDSGIGEASDQRSLAAYCTAAGEAARVDREGGAAQATRLLARGFTLARDAEDRRLVALAAYRMGLAAAAFRGEGGAGARGGDVEAPVASAPQNVALDAMCDRLSRALQDGAAVSADIALQCAASSAAQAGESDLSARAQLRLARLRLQASASPPAPRLGPILRDLSGGAAVTGLQQTARSSNLDFELVARLAETALDAGARDPSVAHAVMALETRAGASRAQQAQAAALRARLDLAAGNSAAAVAGLRRAIFLESQAGAPLRLPDWYMLLAAADPANREQHVAAAYQALESVRPLLPLRDALTEESIFAVRMRGVFEAALEYDLPTQGGGDINSAQLVLEAFRQAEIESVFGNDCVPPRRPIALRDLRAGEVVLYPVLLRDRVELIYASGREGGGYRRISPADTAGRAEIASLVRAMTASLAASNDRRDWEAAARRLYALIIAPIEAHIASDDTTLVIVPDGALRGVPFAALQDASGEYLLRKARIAIAPALAYAQPGAEGGGADLTVVSASLERQVEISAVRFPALAAARAEALAAAGPNRTTLHNFTPAQLERALTGGGVDVLHLATHASFEGRTDRTFIVAQGPNGQGQAIPLADLRRMIALGRTRGDELELLVLSACETAVGDDQASMGLAGAAVQSGARSAIASLWQVNDESTAALMRSFYENYRAGASKGDALRAAQLELINSERFQHPHHWAAFILIGGWR